MSSGYNMREVQVELQPGVKVLVELSKISELRQLLEDLKREGFAPSERMPVEKPDQRKATRREREKPAQALEQETPEHNVEVRSGIGDDSLARARVLAFKDGVPQLLRPGMFTSVSDATLVLLYAIEVGAKNASVAYDDFKAVFDAQNIKTGTPLPMLLSNLRNSWYLDKNLYSSNRTVRLTAKGEKRAEEVLQAVCASRTSVAGAS